MGVTKKSSLTKMTVGTSAFIPVIFGTAKNHLFWSEMVREGKIVFLAKNKYAKITQIQKKKKNNYKTYFHIWVNPQLFYIGRFYRRKQITIPRKSEGILLRSALVPP